MPKVGTTGMIITFSLLPVWMKVLELDAGSVLNPAMASLAAPSGLIIFMASSSSRTLKSTDEMGSSAGKTLRTAAICY